MVDEADLIIAVFDASRNWNSEDDEIINLLKNKKSIIVLNKIDVNNIKIKKENIKDKINEENIIEISAKDNIGIEKIYDEIINKFKLNEINLDNNVVITNIRHKNIINKTLENTKKAIEVIDNDLPIDIIGIYIKEIMEELGKITGENISDEIIKEIFAKFCLGK